MRKIKFSTQTYSKRRKETYEADSTQTMSDDRARLYVGRGVAEYLDGGKQKPESVAAETQATQSTVSSVDYDRTVEGIISKQFDLDYAVNGMAAHFSLDAATVRKELQRRIDERKKTDEANKSTSGETSKTSTTSTTASSQQGSVNDDTVAGATNVAGQNSGSAGQRTDNATGRGRGGARGGATGGSHQ